MPPSFPPPLSFPSPSVISVPLCHSRPPLSLPSPSIIPSPSVIPLPFCHSRESGNPENGSETPDFRYGRTRYPRRPRDPGSGVFPRENSLTGLPAWASVATPSPARGEGACRRSSRTSSGLPTHPSSFPPGHAALLNPPVVLTSGRRSAQRSCQQPPIIYLFSVILHFAQNDRVPRGVTFQVVGGDCVGRRKDSGFPLTTGGNDRRRTEGDRRRTKGDRQGWQGEAGGDGIGEREVGRTEGRLGRSWPTVIPAKAGI